jgi:predicted metal-binding protein
MIDESQIEMRIHTYNKQAKIVSIGMDEIVFELKTKVNCFYCARYNNSWRCPPRIPDIDYHKMLNEYTHAIFVYQSYAVMPENLKEIRTESSLSIHRTLLDAEKYLYENNCSTALSFIGGSCKLCKSGCGAERCNNPYLARIPVEATGINIVKTLAKKGIAVSFPASSEMMRIGLLVWE